MGECDRPVIAVARILLFAVNVAHLAIHGTPLDGGWIDSVLQPVDCYFLSIAAFLTKGTP